MRWGICAFALACGFVVATAPAQAGPYANDIEGAFKRFGHEMAQVPKSFERLGRRPAYRHKTYRSKHHPAHRHRRDWFNFHFGFGL